jgi:hypothetical protein
VQSSGSLFDAALASSLDYSVDNNNDVTSTRWVVFKGYLESDTMSDIITVNKHTFVLIVLICFPLSPPRPAPRPEYQSSSSAFSSHQGSAKSAVETSYIARAVETASPQSPFVALPEPSPIVVEVVAAPEPVAVPVVQEIVTAPPMVVPEPTPIIVVTPLITPLVELSPPVIFSAPSPVAAPSPTLSVDSTTSRSATPSTDSAPAGSSDALSLGGAVKVLTTKERLLARMAEKKKAQEAAAAV